MREKGYPFSFDFTILMCRKEAKPMDEKEQKESEQRRIFSAAKKYVREKQKNKDFTACNKRRNALPFHRPQYDNSSSNAAWRLGNTCEYAPGMYAVHYVRVQARTFLRVSVFINPASAEFQPDSRAGTFTRSPCRERPVRLPRRVHRAGSCGSFPPTRLSRLYRRDMPFGGSAAGMPYYQRSNLLLRLDAGGLEHSVLFAVL